MTLLWHTGRRNGSTRCHEGCGSQLNSGGAINYSYTGNYSGAPRTWHVMLNEQIYTSTQSATSALQFIAMTPCRLAPAQARSFASPGGPYLGIPAAVAGQYKPALRTDLNLVDGAITSNMATVPTCFGIINATVSDPTALILNYFGFFAP
jgi:hypothetical protein